MMAASGSGQTDSRRFPAALIGGLIDATAQPPRWPRMMPSRRSSTAKSGSTSIKDGFSSSFGMPSVDIKLDRETSTQVPGKHCGHRADAAKENSRWRREGSACTTTGARRAAPSSADGTAAGLALESGIRAQTLFQDHELEVRAQRRSEARIAVGKALCLPGAAIAAPLVPGDQAAANRNHRQARDLRPEAAAVILGMFQKRAPHSAILHSRAHGQHADVASRLAAGAASPLHPHAGEQLRGFAQQQYRGI